MYYNIIKLYEIINGKQKKYRYEIEFFTDEKKYKKKLKILKENENIKIDNESYILMYGYLEDALKIILSNGEGYAFYS